MPLPNQAGDKSPTLNSCPIGGIVHFFFFFSPLSHLVPSQPSTSSSHLRPLAPSQPRCEIARTLCDTSTGNTSKSDLTGQNTLSKQLMSHRIKGTHGPGVVLMLYKRLQSHLSSAKTNATQLQSTTPLSSGLSITSLLTFSKKIKKEEDHGQMP